MERDFEGETGIDQDHNDVGDEVDNDEHLSVIVDKDEGIQGNDRQGDIDEHVDISADNQGDKRTQQDIEGTKDIEHIAENKDDMDSDEDEGEFSYPDTSIDFQYTSGGKFQLQRGTSSSSSQATENFVDLGDGEVIDLRSLGKDVENRKRLSAKQRRQMKKKGGLSVLDDAEDQEDGHSGSKPELTKPKSEQNEPPITQQNVAKRGKKSKLKKIKEKYGDQDKEDRELMMQFLGSAGAPKENKRKKGKDSKGRKGSAQGAQGSRKISKDTNKGGAVGIEGDKQVAQDKQSKVGSESLTANSGQALENFAGDLAQELTQDGENEQQDTEVKVLVY